MQADIFERMTDEQLAAYDRYMEHTDHVPGTTTDHLIDVLARMRDALDETKDGLNPLEGEAQRALAEANAILATYGR